MTNVKKLWTQIMMKKVYSSFIKSNVELPNPYITPTGPFPLPSYFLFLLIPNLFNGKL